jgi:hypothetical protein
VFWYRRKAHGTEIPLRLAPYESTFVVFRQDDRAGHVVQSNFDEVTRVTGDRVDAWASQNGRHFVTLAHGGRTVTQFTTVDDLPTPFLVAGRWKLALEGRDFPKQEKTFFHLASWTSAADTRHFSGTGRYEIIFALPKLYLADDLELRLDLGEVGELADVELNGTPVGVRWMRGQTLDITGAVRAGCNRLVVLVTNTLINRVSGFEHPPPVPERLVDHYGSGTTKYSAHRRGPTGFKPLPASGLMGPVRIIARKRATLAIN